MKNRIRYLTLLLALLCGATVWADDDDFNPASPAEPGQTPYKLTLVASPAEGSASLSGSGKYVPGTSVTLGASPKSGWKFVKWTNKDGEEVTSPYTKKEGTEVLTANFEFDPTAPNEPAEIAQNVRYWLTVATEEGGSASGSGRYKAGTQNTVSVSVNDRFVFDGWYDSSGETLLSTSTSYTVTMPMEALTLLAKFSYNPPDPDEPAQIKAPHKVILTAEEGGTVSASPTRLAAGETTTIRAQVNTGYLWDGWYRNGVLYTEAESFTFTMEEADAKFEARFIYNPDDPTEPAPAQPKQYAFHLMNIIGKPGDTVKFPVYFTSQTPAKDISFQLTFPAELVPTNISSPTLADEAAAYSFSCAQGENPDETQKTYVFTLTGGELTEGDRVLLTFDVAIPATQETGRGYGIYVNQIRVTDADANPQPSSARNGRVSVYKNGDSNGDNVVNVTDKMNIITFIKGMDPEVFIKEVSNVNGDEDINITDAMGILEIVRSGEN